MSWLRERWLDIVAEEGSTRSMALLRILMAFTLWSRFAKELMPFRSLEDPAFVAVGIVFYIATTTMAVGFFTRTSMAAVTGVLAALVWGFEGNGSDPSAYTHHHTTMHLLSMAWLALTPAGKSLSIDRWLALGRAERHGGPIPLEVGATWARYLMGAQVATLYLWSAIDKLQRNFLDGTSLQHLVMRYYTGAALPDETWFVALCAFCGTATVVLELVLVVGLFIPRTHKVLMPLGILMHALFYVLIPVNTFTVLMITLYLAYLPPQTVHDAIDRLLAPPTPSPT